MAVLRWRQALRCGPYVQFLQKSWGFDHIRDALTISVTVRIAFMTRIVYIERSSKEMYRLYMDNIVCACGASAVELYRSSKRLIPTLLDKPRTGLVSGLSVPPRQFLADDMAAHGVTAHPYHILVDGNRGYNPRSDISPTSCYRALPPRGLIKVDPCFWTTGPELTYIQAASDATLSDIYIITLGYELCGTYVLDDSWDGLTCTDEPLTSTKKIERFMGSVHRIAGIRRARTMIKYVHDMSNSPMETVLAMLVSLPTTMGGLGLGPIRMNYPVSTPVGHRRIDIGLPRQHVGLEYQGKQFHSIEAAGRDARRQNKIAGSGFTILNVWYEDLVDDHLFQQLTVDLFRALGTRKHIRTQGYDTLQKLLRMQLMPAVRKYGGNEF